MGLRTAYDWKRETGEIQSYQHNQTNGWLHIDPQGQFYDRQAQPISREVALDYATHSTNPSLTQTSQVQLAPDNHSNDQGFGF